MNRWFIKLNNIEKIINSKKVAYNFAYRLEVEIKPDWVLYKFLDCIADNFFALVGAVQADVVAIDDLIMKMVGSFSQEDLMIRICFSFFYLI